MRSCGMRHWLLISLYLGVSLSVFAQGSHGKSNAGDDYDVVYHRMSLYINPKIRPMHGYVVTYFKPVVQDFNRIRFD